MGELSDHPPGDFELFAKRWLPGVVAVFLRAVRDPALAYDLATETVATARVRWASAPQGVEPVTWLLELGADVLAAAVERKRVPSIERRRDHQPRSVTLTVAQQQELMALAEARLELPVDARTVADALARTPPMHALRELGRSDLVHAEPLPDHQRDRHGR